MDNLTVRALSEEMAYIKGYTDALGEINGKRRRKGTDFINIRALGKQAEWVEKWTSKGTKVELTGKIKTGSYTSKQTGNKVYYTEVLANSVGFGESKTEAEARSGSRQQEEPRESMTDADGFMSIPDGIDEELPFA